MWRFEGVQNSVSEGGRQPITVTITCANEERLAQHIASLISNAPKYQLAKNNCSNIVAECLKVASGKGPTFHPTAHDYGKLGKVLGRGIWTPNEVLRYARELSTADQAIV
jgi:hypothetical protein